MADYDQSYDFCSYSHSRDSSGTAESLTPSTPTFSVTEQSRFASSASSLASTPPCEVGDSLPSKSILHDLVEEPSDDNSSYTGERPPSFTDDSDFYSLWPTRTLSRSSYDYDFADSIRADSDYCPDSPRRRRGSPAGNEPGPPPTNLKARLSQRIPSLSRRLREARSYSTLSCQGVRSAPASRPPSIRSPTHAHPASSAVDVTGAVPPLPSNHAELAALHNSDHLGIVEEPIDRKMLASTPLLPPCFLPERTVSETASVQSPLQSPSIVEPSGFAFPESSAATTPVASNLHSPLLSSKESMGSFPPSRASQVVSSADMQVSIEKLAETPADVWADKLGHANFEILPAPYAPVDCDLDSCRQLTEDWELARKRYFHHASTVSEDFGPTSQTFKLTEEKWAATDLQWKQHFELVTARAKSCGVDVASVPCLSESSALARIPTINNTKTIALADNGEIVGPMVTYVSRIKPQSKKNAFRRFFSDLRSSTN